MAEKQAVRGAGGKFAKGNATGGRKKQDPVVMDIFKAACPEAAELLVSTMRDKKQPLDLRLKCADKILDRALGKPKQQVELDGDGVINITMPKELQELSE